MVYYETMTLLCLSLAFFILLFGYSLAPKVPPLPRILRYAIIVVGTIILYLLFANVSANIGDVLDKENVNRLTSDRILLNAFFMFVGGVIGSMLRVLVISPARREKNSARRNSDYVSK